MKRLIYVSKVSSDLSSEQLEKIAQVSIKNNQCDHITGVLLYLNGIFFQIIEGDEIAIDQLYTKILIDDRHTEVLCLKAEYAVETRMFPDWAMKMINLDQHADLLLQPVKILLQTVTESHLILEKYTQPAVTHIIRTGINPLQVLPRVVEKVIFFSDIVSFSTFAEKLPVDKVVSLVNRYLDVCSTMIAKYHGEVTKFIGDCVMASFDRQEADNAIDASLEILKALNDLRNQSPVDDPLNLLYTGIGLASGHVIEGNIGSTVKMDYTLLGDAVNIAARLEALTRCSPYALLLADEVKQLCQKKWNFVELGEYQTKGKQELVKVYSLEEFIVKQSTDTIVPCIKQKLSG